MGRRNVTWIPLARVRKMRRRAPVPCGVVGVVVVLVSSPVPSVPWGCRDHPPPGSLFGGIGGRHLRTGQDVTSIWGALPTDEAVGQALHNPPTRYLARGSPGRTSSSKRGTSSSLSVSSSMSAGSQPRLRPCGLS